MACSLSNSYWLMVVCVSVPCRPGLVMSLAFTMTISTIYSPLSVIQIQIQIYFFNRSFVDLKWIHQVISNLILVSGEDDVGSSVITLKYWNRSKTLFGNENVIRYTFLFHTILTFSSHCCYHPSSIT